MSPTWCMLIWGLVRLWSGTKVGDWALEQACAELECEMTAHRADVVYVVDDTTSWRTIPLLMDGSGFASAWVRMTPAGGECLTDPREYPSVPPLLGVFAGWRVFSAAQDSAEARQHPAWVCLDLVPVSICDGARRRVLAKELRAYLPEEMTCGAVTERSRDDEEQD